MWPWNEPFNLLPDSSRQARFIPGRCIAENFIRIRDILHCAKKNAPLNTILCLGFDEAYDCVCRIYRQKVFFAKRDSLKRLKS